jgi:hypothetical protein
MQASVFDAEGILPALSRAIHLEPGILGKRRLSVGDDSAAVCYDFFLDVFLFGNYFSVVFGRRKRPNAAENYSNLFRVFLYLPAANFPFSPFQLSSSQSRQPF